MSQLGKKNRWKQFQKLNQNKSWKHDNFMVKNYASSSKPYQPANKRSYFPYYTKFPPFNQPFFTSPPKRSKIPHGRRKFEKKGFKRNFGSFVKHFIGHVKTIKADILKSFMRLTQSGLHKKYLIKPKNCVDPWPLLKVIEQIPTTTVKPYKQVNIQTEESWEDLWHTQRVTFRPMRPPNIEQSYGHIDEAKHRQEVQKNDQEVPSFKQTVVVINNVNNAECCVGDRIEDSEVNSSGQYDVGDGNVLDSVDIDGADVDGDCEERVSGHGNCSDGYVGEGTGRYSLSSDGIAGDSFGEKTIAVGRDDVGSDGVKTDPKPSTNMNSLVRFVTSKPWNRLYKDVGARKSTYSAVREGGGVEEVVKGETWRPRARLDLRGNINVDLGEDIGEESDADPDWGMTESTLKAVKRYQTSRPWRELYRDRETVLGIQLLEELVYPR